jgi:hypothetical protein
MRAIGHDRHAQQCCACRKEQQVTIPETQLVTWANQGATTTSATTYTSIKAALDAHDWPDGVRYSVYLQGSYRNATNIRGDSDVDVVVELTSVVKIDVVRLGPDARARARAKYGDSAYGFDEFRADVGRALYNYYGWLTVTDAPKCFKIPAGSGRLGADVVPCMGLHRHTLAGVVEGMTFKPRGSPSWIENFPKLHYEAGAAKNGEKGALGWFKPTVRVLKNMRNRINDGRWFKVNAPSYFLEGMLWNVPDDVLAAGSHQLAVLGSLTHMKKALAADVSFVCPHEQHPLFGDRPEQWNRTEAVAFVDEALKLWDGWYENASFLPRL